MIFKNVLTNEELKGTFKMLSNFEEYLQKKRKIYLQLSVETLTTYAMRSQMRQRHPLSLLLCHIVLGDPTMKEHGGAQATQW